MSRTFSGGFFLFFLIFFAACASSSPQAGARPMRTASTITSTPPPALTRTPSLPTSPTSLPVSVTPPSYVKQTLLSGVGRPDDLAFDQSGRILFSDGNNGTLNRLNADGSVTILLHDSADPEGMVMLPDGTLVFAEQETNQIVSLATGTHIPHVLRTLPGTSSTVTCKHGVDGIALDSTTNTLIIPDSPTGAVYRMSLDGKTLTMLTSGIVRPVGAGVDAQGNIYIADECGHAVWSLTPSGVATRIPGFGMPDDVLPDEHGNLFVIDLDPVIHALIRFNLATGKQALLASQGFIEPQGLLLDAQGNIYVSDDYANAIVKFHPVK